MLNAAPLIACDPGTCTLRDARTCAAPASGVSAGSILCYLVTPVIRYICSISCQINLVHINVFDCDGKRFFTQNRLPKRALWIATIHAKTLSHFSPAGDPRDITDSDASNEPTDPREELRLPPDCKRVNAIRHPRQKQGQNSH